MHASNRNAKIRQHEKAIFTYVMATSDVKVCGISYPLSVRDSTFLPKHW